MSLNGSSRSHTQVHMHSFLPHYIQFTVGKPFPAVFSCRDTEKANRHLRGQLARDRRSRRQQCALHTRGTSFGCNSDADGRTSVWVSHGCRGRFNCSTARAVWTVRCGFRGTLPKGSTTTCATAVDDDARGESRACDADNSRSSACATLKIKYRR